MITLGEHTISDDDLAVIAHVVGNETPEEWATRAYEHPKLGIDAVLAKIEKHRPAYESAKNAPGYKPALDVESDRKATRVAEYAKLKADKKARKTADDATLGALIEAEVARQLALAN